MNKQPVQKRPFYVLMLSLIVILMGGSVALLYQWHQGPVPSHASDDNVVGPPSLPASYVDAIFRRLGSPMVGTGQVVEAASRAQNIDDAFALAVWWTETNDGAAGVGRADRNPGSVRGSVGYPSAYDGYTIYPSYSAAVTYWFSMLKKVYINRGRTTVYSIARPYVGTSTYYLWAGKVTTLMQRYRAEAPQVTPTPTPTIRPTITPQPTPTANKSAVSPIKQTQNQGVQQAATSGLSGNAKLILVLFDLLLALAIGLWARSINRRYSSSPQPSILPGGNLQENLRAGIQQPAALFNSFTGTLRTTEDLAPGIVNTEFLAATNPMMPTYSSSEALLSLGAFMSAQTEFQVPQTPQTAPLPGYSPTMRLPGLALPANSSSQAPNLLHRTRLLPSGPNAGQSSPSEAAASTSEQPQTVGAQAGGGRANGLLSRYRETQAQGGQEPGF